MRYNSNTVVRHNIQDGTTKYRMNRVIESPILTNESKQSNEV
jgi:hypothetical protein